MNIDGIKALMGDMLVNTAKGLTNIVDDNGNFKGEAEKFEGQLKWNYIHTEEDRLFGFENICETLGFDVDHFRRLLYQEIEQKGGEELLEHYQSYKPREKSA